MIYGRDLSTPAYTYTFQNGGLYDDVLDRYASYYVNAGDSLGFWYFPLPNNAQGGYTWDPTTLGIPDFRFNSGRTPEGEPYIDLNGNGFWDQGDYLTDTNGNGEFDYERRDVINEHQAESYTDGDQSLGEPFTDV
ncbi:MAG: hypothetical protein GY839_16020, partial [candidate division Zixibacteria bacterium]|nr:hypothetical protein [candidate division Zixibacteria bacterium]